MNVSKVLHNGYISLLISTIFGTWECADVVLCLAQTILTTYIK
jgi:hypothetical protein